MLTKDIFGGLRSRNCRRYMISSASTRRGSFLARRHFLSFFLQRNSLEDDFGLSAVRDLSRMYHRVKDWPNAIRCESLAVGVATNVKGKDSKEAIRFKRELALAFWGAKQYEGGFDLDHEVLKTCTRVYGAVHPTTVEALLAVCEAMRPCK